MPKIELGKTHYINVYDCCGHFGYSIPWADFKAEGIYPTGYPKQNIDKFFIFLWSKASPLYSKGQEISERLKDVSICLDDFASIYEMPGMFDWEKLKQHIIKVAREKELILSINWTPMPKEPQITNR